MLTMLMRLLLHLIIQVPLTQAMHMAQPFYGLVVMVAYLVVLLVLPLKDSKFFHNSRQDLHLPNLI